MSLVLTYLTYVGVGGISVFALSIVRKLNSERNVPFQKHNIVVFRRKSENVRK